MGRLLLFTFVLLSSSAAAYIDPGTGGAIIGSSGPIIAGIIAVVGAIAGRYFIVPIKRAASGVIKVFKKGQ